MQEPVSIISYLQDSEAAENSCNIHEEAAVYLFKHSLVVLVKSVIKTLVALPVETARLQEEYLTSYFPIISYLLKRYMTNDNIVTVDADIQTLKQ